MPVALKLKPKKKTGVFENFDLQENDVLHFDGDEVEVYRGDRKLCRAKWADCDPPKLLTKRAAKDLELKAGAEKKATEYPPIPPGAKWISFNPTKTPGGGHPVLIMPHEDGSATVLGGAGGKFNLLRLNRLGTPEDWKRAAKERSQKKREAEKERKANQSEDEAKAEKEAAEKLKEFKRTKTHENAAKTLEALDKAGIDIGLTPEHKNALSMPPDPGSDPEKVKEWQQLTKEAVQKVKQVQAAYENKLVTDHEARAAARLGDSDIDTNNRVIQNQPHTACANDGSELSQIVALPGGEWMVTGGDAPKMFNNWKDAAKEHLRNVLEKEQDLGGDRTQGDSFYSPSNWVKAVGPENLPEGFEFKPEIALEIARLSMERKANDKAALEGEDAIKKRNPLELGSGFDVTTVREISDREVLDKLESDAKTLKDAFTNNKFLELIENEGDAQALKKHHQVGGYAGIAEIASEVLKQNPISRQLIDLLGHNEGAKVLAYMMRSNMTDQEYEQVAGAIAAHHAQTSTNIAKGATKQVGKLLERLKGLHEEILGINELAIGGIDASTQLQLDSLHYEAQTIQNSVQQIMGTTLGKLQASAAMVAATEGKPKTLRFSGESAKAIAAQIPGMMGGLGEEEKGPSIFEAYGLTAEDFKQFAGPDGDVIQINESGLQKLAVGYNPEDREAYERAVAIKRGDFDEEGFVPEGFSHYQPLTEFQPSDEKNNFGITPQVREDMSDEELKDAIADYFGQLVSSGVNPIDAKDMVYNQTFASTIGYDMHSDFAQRLYAQTGEVIQDLAHVRDERGSRISTANLISGMESLAKQAEEKRWNQGDATVNSRKLNHEVSTEAAHRTLAAMPMARLAFKPIAEMSGKERRMLRDYAISEVWNPTEADSPKGLASNETFAGIDEVAEALSSPGKHGESRNVKGANYLYHKGEGRWLTERDFEAKKQAEEEAKNTEQFGLFGSDFGTTEPSQEPEEDAEPQYTSEAIATDSDFDESDDQWTQFTKLMRGSDQAYATALEHLRGKFTQRFAHAYEQLAGEPAPVTSKSHAHFRDYLTAKLPAKQRQEFLQWQRARDQTDAAKGRKRNEKGRFNKEDDDWYEKFNELKGSALQGELTDTAQHRSAPSAYKYSTLGEQALSDLNQVMAKVSPNFEQLNDATKIIPKVNWGAGTQHATKQRALRFLEAQKKIGLTFGAGCVHGSTLLKCEKTGVEQTFFDWWVSGDRPWVKALDEETDRTVVVQASPVFVKTIDQMYRVTLENGANIVVTAAHRFLSLDGWVKLESLHPGAAIKAATHTDPSRFSAKKDLDALPLQTASVVRQERSPFSSFLLSTPSLCSHHDDSFAPVSIQSVECCGTIPGAFPVPQESSSDTSLLTRPEGVHRWMRTLPNFSDRYSAYSRQYDARPLVAQGAFQEPAPSLNGVHEYIHSYSRKGESLLALSPKYSHPYQLSVLPSTTNSKPQPAHQGHAVRYHNLPSDLAPSPNSRHTSQRSRKLTSFHPNTTETTFQDQPLTLLRDLSSIRFDGEEYCFSANACEPSQRKRSTLPQSVQSSDTHPSRASLQAQDRSSSSWVKISHIENVGIYPVFDITVPVYHNYESHGIFNHNSGKTSIMLGCFSHLHSQGKVGKAIVCVPSSIIGQFTGEAATFLKPGTYNYSANMGMSREERLKAIADPNNHIFITTRESMTNDMMYLVEKHSGVDAESYRKLPENKQKELMKQACSAEGIDAEKLLLCVDESHDVTARKGSEPSKRSLALAHLGHHSGYFVQSTADLLKNDLSEAYNFLHSVAPDKFNDMNKFLAEYGGNTQASKRALQRVIAPYSYAAFTKPQDKDGRTLKMNTFEPKIKASAYISEGRQKILDDMKVLSQWQSQRREELKQEKGEKYLPKPEDFNTAWTVPEVRASLDRLASENTWHKLPDEEKQKVIGGQMMAIGTLKKNALYRLYHLAPPEENPKMQWVVDHAVKKFKKEGKPGVVFSASSTMCEAMVKEFQKKGLRVAYIHGGLNSAGKDQERLKFQPPPGREPQADILIATDAARTGVTLTRGKVLYHADIANTEMGFSQRSARVHRLSQDIDTEIYTPLLDSPEEKMALSRMERKGETGKPFKAKAERIDDTGLSRAIKEKRSLSGARNVA